MGAVLASMSLTYRAAVEGRRPLRSRTCPARAMLAPGSGAVGSVTAVVALGAEAAGVSLRAGLAAKGEGGGAGLFWTACLLPKTLQPASPRQTVTKPTPTEVRTAW